jgi:hypothetical protein
LKSEICVPTNTTSGEVGSPLKEISDLSDLNIIPSFLKNAYWLKMVCGILMVLFSISAQQLFQMAGTDFNA